MAKPYSTHLKLNRTLLTRFFSKVVIDPDTTFQGVPCWLFQKTNHTGYARFSIAHRYLPMAHRVCYELFVGEIPEGLTLDHLCRRRNCVNPIHLEPVTLRENTIRGVGPSAQNAKKTVCSNGHEYTEQNTRIFTSARSVHRRRACRKCSVIASKVYRKRIPKDDPRWATILKQKREYKARKRAEVKAI